MLISAGLPMKAIQERLGHTSIVEAPLFRGALAMARMHLDVG